MRLSECAVGGPKGKVLMDTSENDPLRRSFLEGVREHDM